MADEIEYPTQDHLKNLFEYRDGRLYWKMNKNRGVKAGDMAGYIDSSREKPRYRVFIKNKLYVGARVIFMWHHGFLPEIVDHKDRNQLNDNIDNLRAANRSQNQKNRGSMKNSSSKYIGVGIVRGSKWKIGYRWQAKLRSGGKTISIGYFTNEDEAALAYNDAALKYNGEFASLNIIEK